MRNLFFGDSLTSGDNNNHKSYVDYISDSKKIGISGTTIGEYSIYPVDGNSLLSQIPRYTKEIKEAENIFLEYGINDSTAMLTNYVTGSKVLIDFVKAIDAIKQLNPNAKIYFLTVFGVSNAFGETQTKYLNNEYLKKYCEYKKQSYKPIEWVGVYYGFLGNVIDPSGIECIEMFENDEQYLDNLDEDGLHPNDKGYQIIAENIKKELYKKWNVA